MIFPALRKSTKVPVGSGLTVSADAFFIHGVSKAHFCVWTEQLEQRPGPVRAYITRWRQVGRRQTSKEIWDLIFCIVAENPTWAHLAFTVSFSCSGSMFPRERSPAG